MEEKERYEIHIYDDCNVDLYNNGVLDKSITDTWKLEKLINQQDKKIKDLETKLAERTEQLKIALKDFNDIQKENDNRTAIAELEQLKKLLVEKMKLASDKLDCAYYINQQINELKGKVEDE